MNWYANQGGTQGIIIEEDTGETIAVSYNVENASLIAAAPEAIDLLKKVLETLDDMTTEEFSLGRDKFIRDGINSLLYKFNL